MGEQPLVPAPDAAMSCSISAASVTPRPEPPYSSGMIAPSQPAWANAFTNSQGYSALPSFSSQYSGEKDRARLEISLRISSCCSVNAKSMAPASLEVCPILLRASGYDRARSGRRWAMTFVERMVGAAKLSSEAYEDVEADKGATGQALAVVVLSSVATGIGAGAGIAGLVAATVLALIGWLIWAGLIYLVGARWLPEPGTQSNAGELMRTIGFATSPGILRVVGIIPFLTWLAFTITSFWMLATMVVAVRQALDYRSTWRAVGVCLLGWLVQFAAFVLVASLLPSR